MQVATHLKSLAKKANLNEGHVKATRVYKARVASLISERAKQEARNSLREAEVELREVRDGMQVVQDDLLKAKDGLQSAQSEL